MIRRMIGFASIAALLGCTTPAPAQPSGPPKLLVVISVDQFSADLFSEYRAHFTGGLKRLTQGVVFPNGYQSHAATETCPGHATILTGVHPARAGIIANSWIDQRIARADKNVYCAEDETLGKSSKSADYIPATVHLKVPTLGDRMKDANPASRIVAVAGKDRAAIMMGGHKTDAIWFLNPRDTTSFETLRGRPMIATVERANAVIAAALAKAMPPMKLAGVCAARSRAVAISPTKSVGDGRFARDAGAKPRFRASPEADAAVIALAGDLIADMKLGQGPAIDLIAIGASATDFIGHTYGTGGSEMCLQLMALDAALGHLFAKLDAAKIDYAIALTADHGGQDAPERTDENGVTDAARMMFDPRKIGEDVARALGLPGSVLAASEAAGDVWLANTVPASLRAQAISQVKAAYLAFPQVATVFTADELKATPVASTPPDSWSLAERARASFDPDRSGDLLVMLKPRITPIPAAVAAGTYIATHGSPWDYDRRVPILFWRKGMAGFEQPNSIETTDIAPTLAALIGLPIATGQMDGRCRDLVAGVGSSCPPDRQWYIGLDGKTMPGSPQPR
jgi:predicted AlkP superfamily pyrophosphatase or phosphodiesterase